MTRKGTIGGIGALMLLVAAVAVAMRNHREVSEVYSDDWVEGIVRGWPPSAWALLGTTFRIGSDFRAGLVVMTVGLGLATLRRPFVKPGRRWPGRGRAAIVSACLGVGNGVIHAASEAIADPTSTYYGLANLHFLSNTLSHCASIPPGAVLGAWSLLALAGRWGSNADGLERPGRVLGWCWLGSFAFELIRSALW